MRTTKEHFNWCKERAFQYLDMGDAQQGFTSFVSDMSANPDTSKRMNPILNAIGMMEILRGPEAVRRWIDGFPSP